MLVARAASSEWEGPFSPLLDISGSPDRPCRNPTDRLWKVAPLCVAERGSLRYAAMHGDLGETGESFQLAHAAGR